MSGLAERLAGQAAHRLVTSYADPDEGQMAGEIAAAIRAALDEAARLARLGITPNPYSAFSPEREFAAGGNIAAENIAAAIEALQ